MNYFLLQVHYVIYEYLVFEVVFICLFETNYPSAYCKIAIGSDQKKFH